jgi:ribosomal-protein-alanine N-acetyltransferase
MSWAAAEVRIRRMQAWDLRRVMEIAESLPGAPQWRISAYLRALDPLNAPRRIALVAEEQETDAVAGFAVGSLLAPEAELETIAVAEEAQRRGVGAQLFRAMVEELRAEQVTEVMLEVRASNLPALGFYQAVGFVETGRRPRYYADPQEDAILLRLRVGESLGGAGR